MIRLIEEKNEWSKILKEMDTFDFYHTHEYHDSLKKENEHPIFILYIEGKYKIGMPFFKKKINSTHYDLTSVHGYLGPISKGIDDHFNNLEFHRSLSKLLIKEKIVSVFSKLNPYIPNQKKILHPLGSIENVGELIYFDQRIEECDQLKQYNRNTRQKIAQLKNICTVRPIKNATELNQFIDLYHASMSRLKAKKIFFFNKEHFHSILNSKMFDALLLLAINNDNDDIMAGALCIKTNDIAHIELACTNEKYYKNSPVRILFEAARILYKTKQTTVLNLGGGSEGRNGSLMKFKSSFTQHYANFDVWKLIVIEDVYDTLQTKEQKKTASSFFPKYRLPLPLNN